MEFIGRGAIANLNQYIHGQRILLFTQDGVYNLFENILKPQLKDALVSFYKQISPNPKREEIQTAQDILKNQEIDAVIAFGGGSVIDFAKAFRFYDSRDIPLIAMPTTAGTGSQATQFAVVYIDGKKTSLDDPKILPNITIADSQFVENAPQNVKASCAMDAYCQAIESFWAKGATTESRNYATEAIILCRDYLIKAVTTNDVQANEKMTLAAHMAGKAINISRTTAAHALSYKITSKYGISHGHAVALSIAGLFEHNINVLPQDEQNILFQTMQINKVNIRAYFHTLMADIGLEDNLEKLGIKNLNEIVDSVNVERLANNPKLLNKSDLFNILKN